MVRWPILLFEVFYVLQNRPAGSRELGIADFTSDRSTTSLQLIEWICRSEKSPLRTPLPMVPDHISAELSETL
jgi:hypothetical protein